MIIFNQCRIDPDGKHLIIEASVENLKFYKDVYIESVIIDTDETFSSTGPSNNPVFNQNFITDQIDEETTCGSVETNDIGIKHIRLTLSEKDLRAGSFTNNIFFVYVVATGVPDSCTPCGMDNKITMGIAVYLKPLYDMAMKYIKEMDSNCNTPKGFIDMILRLKAFDLSLKTSNIPTAIKYWDKLFKNKISISPNKNCGCNGLN